jgi:cytochrome c biogenesis protein CcdA/thiol-disulfide isomerase/thioredoxin
MILLVVFAFIAGAGTALSPCVLPVLPALLSAGATGGRRRPLGVVTGLAVTFSITIVGVSKLVDGVGLGASGARTLAIVFLAGFGIITLVPALGDRLAAVLSPLARFGPSSAGNGFWSGVLVGGALGFLYAPCAGPILAAVITVGSASSDVVAVAIAYAAGSALVLLALALGGRALSERVRRAGRGPALHRVLGAVMLATALAMSFSWDVRFQTAIADHLPGAVVNPTRSIERSARVTHELDHLRGPSRFASTSPKGLGSSHGGSKTSGGHASALPRLGEAPDFTGNQRWWNTPGDKPLSLAALRGNVVLVDFWTYTCINCIRTLPELRAWDERYRADGLTIVGVHSPEFDFEKNAGNVAAAIRQNRLRYPIAQDNDLATWNAWGNQYWPAEYLIDSRGEVRYAHFGEGDTDVTENAIRSLLAERSSRALGAMAHPDRTFDPARQATPETYIGTARDAGWVGANAPRDGEHGYPAAPASLGLSRFALSGRWRIDGEHATAGTGAAITVRYQAKDVYLVLSPAARGGSVRVLLDGRRIPAAQAGGDVHGGGVRVDSQRLYHLVHRDDVERHRLELRFSPGVSGYAFTFG